MDGTNISPLGIIFIMAGSLALDTSKGICSNWKMDHDWENYLDESFILWEKNDSRLIECAMICSRNPSCFSFFHHPTMKTCLFSRSYKRGLPANQKTLHGWNYYTQPHHCVGDYEYNQTLGLCYKLYQEYFDHKQAMGACERNGAKLLIINNPAELQHFTTMIGDTDWAWIGLKGYSNMPPVFTWWNGQVASNISWYQGYPKNGYESGVQLFNGTFVNNPIYSVSSSAVCQRLI